MKELFDADELLLKLPRPKCKKHGIPMECHLCRQEWEVAHGNN